MNYIITFLEGIITFISPCLLPMLPIYISYFAGGGERSTGKTVKNAFGFILAYCSQRFYTILQNVGMKYFAIRQIGLDTVTKF